ncbi:MAG: metallophosphoesterase [Verrucomicrobiota bacterium]
MQAQAVTHTVCIGDIVGYNADPKACLEIVRALGCPIVKGNHDEEASEGREVEHFNDMALSAIRYTRSQLTKEQREFLRALPLQRPVNSFTVVHSTLDQPNRWGYVFSCLEAEQLPVPEDQPLLLRPHPRAARLHPRHQGARVLLQEDRHPAGEEILRQRRQRGASPATATGARPTSSTTPGANTIELRRLPYDLAKAQAKIMNAGLPARLAERLANAV